MHWAFSTPFLVLLITGVALGLPQTEILLTHRDLIRAVHLAAAVGLVALPAAVWLAGNRRGLHCRRDHLLCFCRRIESVHPSPSVVKPRHLPSTTSPKLSLFRSTPDYFRSAGTQYLTRAVSSVCVSC